MCLPPPNMCTKRCPMGADPSGSQDFCLPVWGTDVPDPLASISARQRSGAGTACPPKGAPGLGAPRSRAHEPRPGEPRLVGHPPCHTSAMCASMYTCVAACKHECLCVHVCTRVCVHHMLGNVGVIPGDTEVRSPGGKSWAGQRPAHPSARHLRAGGTWPRVSDAGAGVSWSSPVRLAAQLDLVSVTVDGRGQDPFGERQRE